ncbi:MAG TPA: 16S rRNA (guanine(527)-N(7))-methyltransferase RsmG [Bacteroidales bacterium]|nr:16S rRNA (guanine(527)-N(7))-methyltransferase RsmG [Bacteroidales bacterium]
MDSADILLKYFPEISDLQVEKFRAMGTFYESWNAKINVISRKDIAFLYQRHVLHSLAIARFISFAPRSVVLDLGTGGGFPGIPLAIFFPEVRFVLLDSVKKKINVVARALSELNISNAEPVCRRVEEWKEQVDFVVSRAVAPLPQLVKFTEKIIRPGNRSTLPNGLICLKGGDLEKEIRETGRNVVWKDISQWFPEEFFTGKKVLYIPAPA